MKSMLDRLAGAGRRGLGHWRVRLVISGLVAGVSFLFSGYAVYVGWGALEVHLRHLNYWFLALALFLYPLGFVPVIWGWHTIMSRIGGWQNTGTNVRLYCLSCLPKRIPGFVWHIASRIALYREYQVDYTITLTATAIEVVLWILSGLSLYLLSLGISSAELAPRLGSTAVVAVILALTSPVWVPLLHQGLRRLLAGMGTPVPAELHPGDVLRLLGISGLAWVGGGFVLYVLANAVTAVPLTQLPNLIGAWGAAGAISLTVGFLVQGMGLREVTLAVLLSSHMPLSVAIVISLLFRLLLTGGEFVWALLFAWLADRLPE